MIRTACKYFRLPRWDLNPSLSASSVAPTRRCGIRPASTTTSTTPPISAEEMPFLHHGRRPRFRDYEKFQSPRKRASKILHAITSEAVEKSKAARPKVWSNFRVGDAIEIKMVSQGGVKSHDFEKIRGVVLGIFRNGLDTSVLIRDVVYGQPVERRVPLHSPLLRSVKVLEENFVFKGKRKVKRAKLYYLSNRNPLETRVTKW